MHGEPLRYSLQGNWWICPEASICHTYVTDEYIFTQYLDSVLVQCQTRLTEGMYEYYWNQAVK